MEANYAHISSSDSLRGPLGRGERTLFQDVAALAGVTSLALLALTALWMGMDQGTGTESLPKYWMSYGRPITTGFVTAVVVLWAAYTFRQRDVHLLRDGLSKTKVQAEDIRTLFDAVFEDTSDGLWILDSDYKVLFANTVARRIHGHKITVGKRYPCHADEQSRVVCRQCPSQKNTPMCRPSLKKGVRTETRTGEVVTVETYPIAQRDQPPWLLIVEKIVTEQHKLQASLLHQEKMAAFGLLAAGIAHDVGSPISGIELHLQLLDNEELPIEARESVGIVQREIARMRRTLRELVDFARRRRSVPELVPVQRVINDALKLLRYDRRMRLIRVNFNVDPTVLPVEIIEDHLMQVAINLILNAIDAMPNGGNIDIELRPSQEGIALRIHDTGVGMERGVLEKCCDPLFSTKPAGKGTGLGLSMCQDIIDVAGGNLELHSAPNKGTTVVVTLPTVSME